MKIKTGKGIAATVLTLAALSIPAAAEAHSLRHSKVTQSAERLLPPCPTEDSGNCVYDAMHMGIPGGDSFIAGPMKDPAPDTRVITHERAHHMIWLWIWRNGQPFTFNDPEWEIAEWGKDAPGNCRINSNGETAYLACPGNVWAAS